MLRYWGKAGIPKKDWDLERKTGMTQNNFTEKKRGKEIPEKTYLN